MNGLNVLGSGFKAVKAGLEQITFNNAGPNKNPKSKGFKWSRQINKTAKGRYGLKNSKVNARSFGPGPRAITTRGAARGSQTFNTSAQAVAASRPRAAIRRRHK